MRKYIKVNSIQIYNLCNILNCKEKYFKVFFIMGDLNEKNR